MGCDIHLYAEKRVNSKWEFVIGENFYDGRNYSLFSILADVRNGCGYKPIDYPRGLPKDLSKELEQLADSWRGDGHSYSWFTLKELLKYNWDRKIKYSGLVDTEQFIVFKDKGRPSHWFEEKKGYELVTMKAMEKAIAEGKEDVCCLAKWEELYRDHASNFCEVTIPKLQTLSDKPEDVRIVFWFDN